MNVEHEIRIMTLLADELRWHRLYVRWPFGGSGGIRVKGRPGYVSFRDLYEVAEEHIPVIKKKLAKELAWEMFFMEDETRSYYPSVSHGDLLDDPTMQRAFRKVFWKKSRKLEHRKGDIAGLHRRSGLLTCITSTLTQYQMMFCGERFDYYDHA